MSFRRLHLFGIVALACAAIASAGTRLVAAVDRAVAFVFDVLARPDRAVYAGFNPMGAIDGPVYDSPPIHSLRHEAGTSRRAAARNI